MALSKVDLLSIQQGCLQSEISFPIRNNHNPKEGYEQDKVVKLRNPMAKTLPVNDA